MLVFVWMKMNMKFMCHRIFENALYTVFCVLFIFLWISTMHLGIFSKEQQNINSEELIENFVL